MAEGLLKVIIGEIFQNPKEKIDIQNEEIQGTPNKKKTETNMKTHFN